MPVLTLGNDKIFYTDSAPEALATLVLVHGSGGDHTHWPAPLREERRFRVVGIDLPGHGRSGGNGCREVEGYADWLFRFIELLELKEVAIAGHSLGGAIVQMVAAAQPVWLRRIVLVGTGARLKVAPAILEGLLRNYSETVDRVSRWAFGASAAPDLVETFKRGLLRTDPIVTHGDFSACDRFDLMDRIGEISVPALVISAEADRMTPMKYGRYLAEKIADARMTVIPDAGHMMMIEQPEAFANAVKDFCQFPTEKIL